MQYERWKRALYLGLAVVCLVALAAAFAVAGEGGRAGVWALILFYWGTALLMVLVHHLAGRQDAVSRYLARHEPLAGPRPGSELPG